MFTMIWRNILIIFGSAFAFVALTMLFEKLDKSIQKVISVMGNSLLVVVMITLLWINTVGYFVKTSNNNANLGVFDENVIEYLDFFSANSIFDKGNITGPVVTIDVNNKVIHPFLRKIPKSIAAQTPEGVATLVFIERKKMKVCEYDKKIDNKTIVGYRLIWDVKVIDKNTRSTILTKKYTYDPPQMYFLKDWYHQEWYEIIKEDGVPGLIPRDIFNQESLYNDIIELCDYSPLSPWPFKWNK